MLRRWVKPSSDTEQQKQERAVRMVKSAMRSWPALHQNATYKVYPKGSYANNTNVRLDSDVDIVVENHNCLYYEYRDCAQLPGADGGAYDGQWTPGAWRREILAALEYSFPDEVDGSGRIAITIDEHDGTRPDIDVVPSFDFVRYYSSDQRTQVKGSKVFPQTGSPIINFPQEQLKNGRVKNGLTNGAYKRYARALKSAENQLVAEGRMKPKPSYLMECLAYAVPNPVLVGGATLDSGFRGTLDWLWDNLQTPSFSMDAWVEPHGLEWTFRTDAAWDISDARELVSETWDYLDY